MPERKGSTEAIDAIDRLLQELWSAARDGDLAWVEIWSDDLREKIADAILPSGTVAVDRGRLDRLVELAASWDDMAGAIDWDAWDHHWDNEIDRLQRATDALKPTDLDTTPSPADGEGGAG